MNIEIKNLTKTFAHKTIYQDFNLTIQNHEMIALVGNSGCGKSTLLNMIGLIEKFDSGCIDFDGDFCKNILSRKAEKIRRYQIGYLFQNFALMDNLTVQENLEIAFAYTKIKDKGEKEKLLNESLTKVHLHPSILSQKAYELSGGEQQRVAIARLYLKPCELILADEPTGSLDENNKHIIMNLLRHLHDLGKTLVIVTHDKQVAAQCTRTIFLEKV